jgi:F-type H+-transporting ATPase subunit b
MASRGSGKGIVATIKRWLASRPRRFVVVGGLVTASWAMPAIAQENAAGTHPVAVAPGEAQEGEAREGGEHEGMHAPGKFNVADFDRFKQEKDLAEKGAPGPHGGPLVPTTPYIYLVINFVVLLAIYYYAGKTGVMRELKARRETVSRELDEAAKIKAEAKAKLEEYSARIGRLDDELQRIKTELIAAGEAERDRIVKEAETKAERMRKDAEFLLSQELKQLRNDLIVQTVDTATAAAQAVLKSSVTQADHDRLADQYLHQLAASPAQAAQKGAAS